MQWYPVELSRIAYCLGLLLCWLSPIWWPRPLGAVLRPNAPWHGFLWTDVLLFYIIWVFLHLLKFQVILPSLFPSPKNSVRVELKCTDVRLTHCQFLCNQWLKGTLLIHLGKTHKLDFDTLLNLLVKTSTTQMLFLLQLLEKYISPCPIHPSALLSLTWQDSLPLTF